MKKIGLTLLSLFLVWHSYNTLSHPGKLITNSWALTLLNAWLINMYITGIFAFLSFVYPVQKLLPASYFKVREPKKLKGIYKFLRVDLFRKFLLATIWKPQEKRKAYFDGTRSGLANWIEQSMKSEWGHLLPFYILIFVSFYLFINNAILLGIFVFLINFLGNFYPVILQRHHRMRIQLLERRMNQKL